VQLIWGKITSRQLHIVGIESSHRCNPPLLPSEKPNVYNIAIKPYFIIVKSTLCYFSPITEPRRRNSLAWNMSELYLTQNTLQAHLRAGYLTMVIRSIPTGFEVIPQETGTTRSLSNYQARTIWIKIEIVCIGIFRQNFIPSMVGGLGQRDNEIAWPMLWQILGEYRVR
jgi:hypothetical protein